MAGFLPATTARPGSAKSTDQNFLGMRLLCARRYGHSFKRWMPEKNAEITGHSATLFCWLEAALKRRFVYGQSGRTGGFPARDGVPLELQIASGARRRNA